jgi:hypothetical protein
MVAGVLGPLLRLHGHDLFGVLQHDVDRGDERSPD